MNQQTHLGPPPIGLTQYGLGLPPIEVPPVGLTPFGLAMLHNLRQKSKFDP